MERLNRYLKYLAVVTLATFLGCASSGSGTRSTNTTRFNDDRNTVQVTNSVTPLDDYLRRIPGVEVFGSGPDARIIVRGVQSLFGSNDPLYVINGVQSGRNFAEVYHFVAMETVNSIRVLKGAQTTRYGMEGANGVILISTD